MKQMFNFTPNMTHPFLRYAENAHIDNKKVLRLIDDLRQGLSEENQIQSQEQKNCSNNYNRTLLFSATYTKYELTFKWFAKINDKVQIKFSTSHTSFTGGYQFRYNNPTSNKMCLTNSSASSEMEITNYTKSTEAPASVADDFYTVKVASEGTWMSATAILDFLKNEVGISLLKPINVSHFGRTLSAIPGLKKHVTCTNTTYLVKKKQRK